MANTSLLKGIRCPKCKHDENFFVTAQVTLEVTDSGTEDPGADKEWDEDSPFTCPNCGYDGEMSDFRVENQTSDL